jgi:thiol-disulfide isomerase/thioredoxin
MRLLCAAVLTLTVGLFVATGDDKKDPPKGGDRAKRLKDLETKYDKEFADLKKKFQDAKTPDEQGRLRTEARELTVLTAEKAYKIAEENPKDDVAADAAVFIVTKCVFAAGQPEYDKAIALLVDHHITNPRIAPAVVAVGQFGPVGEKLVAAAEKSDNKQVKGAALYARGVALAEQADDADDAKEQAALTEKAIKLLEQAAELAPDVKISGGKETLGEAARTEITSLKATKIDSPAPDVTGRDLDGKPMKLSSFKGKVVLLDVWATWCPPCRGMIPHEREMVKRLKDRPFVLVSVSADEKKSALTDFLRENEMPWVHWWDGDERKILRTFRVQAFPTLYLIDHKGIIRKKWVGAPKNDALEDAVNELVVAAEKEKKG